MTEQEMENKWYEEFERIFSADFDGSKMLPENDPLELKWRGFLAAKKSQSVVELPKYHDFYTQMVCGNYFDADEVENRLTAAGIKYTIGE